MRKTLLVSAAVLGLAAGPALAQSEPSQTIRPGHVPGVGESEPASTQASNINGSDVRSDIAPRLPSPPGGPNEDAGHYIRAAQRALSRHRTGEAQQAIEMAETRVLDRSVVATQINTPDQNPTITALEAARQDLAKHNWQGADRDLGQALMQTAAADGSAGMNNNGMDGAGMANGAGMNGGAMNNGGMNNGMSGMSPSASAPPPPGSTAPGESMVPPTGGAGQQ